VTAELLKGRLIVLRTQSTGRAGRNKLKITHLPTKSGRYTVKLIALGADGQSASDHASVTVKAKSKKRKRAKHSSRR